VQIAQTATDDDSLGLVCSSNVLLLCEDGDESTDDADDRSCSNCSDNTNTLIKSTSITTDAIILFTVVKFNVAPYSKWARICLPGSEPNLPTHKQDNNRLPRAVSATGFFLVRPLRFTCGQSLPYAKYS
jgi:hypothetical protein